MEKIKQVIKNIPHGNHQIINNDYDDIKKKLFAKYSVCDPDCPICGGNGFCRRELPIDHPEFGKAIPCPNMYQAQIKNEANRYGLLPDEIEKLNWGLLLDINDCPGIAYQIKSVLDSKKGGFVYLWGEHGLAKTMLLKISVAYALRDLRKKAAYTNMVNILDEIKAAYDTSNPSEESIRRLDWWSHIDILAIDEFDRINETEWAKERRFRLMDTRYTSGFRGETTTLIASNRSPNNQEGYLRSRIKDGRFQVIFMKGEDARPGMTNDFSY